MWGKYGAIGTCQVIRETQDLMKKWSSEKKTSVFGTKNTENQWNSFIRFLSYSTGGKDGQLLPHILSADFCKNYILNLGDHKM
jgi:hypothetical protein